MADPEVVLAQCAIELLCGLGNAAKSLVLEVLDKYIALLDVYIAALEAKLVYLDILTAPVQLAQSLVDSILNELRQYSTLIPFQLVEQCADLSKFTESIAATFDAISSSIRAVTTDLNRLLSFADEVRALIVDLKQVRATYRALLDSMLSCAPA